ncbi:MAG TPA: PilZ domain-containing protein [Pyrinomonadaceae bacterium]|nr:PilZ domain-containing protein [Pyrinomonadaceae bacterium]HMP66945.1 PilZ domain-containing protein [Pyrinomonadaceae bacterium]
MDLTFRLSTPIVLPPSGLFAYPELHQRLPTNNKMSINQRRHLRFSLDIPATLVSKYGESHQTYLQQISIGGCFTDWEENLYPGDEFRLEIQLPNKNRLPLKCKAIYRFEDTGIGVRFIDICQFEQELISEIIADRMEKEGLPEFPSPFKTPSQYIEEDESPKIKSKRERREEMLEEAMAGEEIA